MLGVRKRRGQWVIQNAARLVKVDAMLGQVGERLLGVPLDVHVESLRCSDVCRTRTLIKVFNRAGSWPPGAGSGQVCLVADRARDLVVTSGDPPTESHGGDRCEADHDAGESGNHEPVDPAALREEDPPQ